MSNKNTVGIIKKYIRNQNRLLQKSLTKYPHIYSKQITNIIRAQEIQLRKSLNDNINQAKININFLKSKLAETKKNVYFNKELSDIKSNKLKIAQIKKKIVIQNNKEKAHQVKKEQEEISKQIKKGNKKVGENYLLEAEALGTITIEQYKNLSDNEKRYYFKFSEKHYGRWVKLHRFFSSNIPDILLLVTEEFEKYKKISKDKKELKDLKYYVYDWDYTSFFDQLRSKLIELGDFEVSDKLRYNDEMFKKSKLTIPQAGDFYYTDKEKSPYNKVRIRDEERGYTQPIENLVSALQSTIKFDISETKYVTNKAYIVNITKVGKLTFKDLIMKLLTLHDKTLEDINGEEEADYEDNLCVARAIIKTLSAHPNNVTPTIYTLHEQFLTLEGEPDIRNGVSTKDVINWVKKFQHDRISVFAFDPLLNCYERYISSHGDVSIMLINNNNHCYPITNEEIKSTISRSSKLSFSKPKWEINFNDYFLFKNIDSFTEDAIGIDGYVEACINYENLYQQIIEGKYPGKNKVIVIELDDNNDLKNICADVINVTNSNVYNININENGKMCSFIHPISDQVFELSTDFEIRRRMCQTLYDHNNLDNFLFKNQTYADIGRIIYEAEFGKLPKSDTFKEDLYLVDKFTTSPLIKKNIFDYEKENCFCYDINSSYLTAIMEMKYDYPVFTYFDKNFRIFDNTSPILPLGEYIIDNVVISKYNDFTLPSRILSYEVLKKLMKKGLIERKHIIMYRIAKEYLSKDNLKNFITLVQKIFPDKKDYKSIVNHFIGTIGKRYATTTKAFVTNDINTVFSAFNQYSVNNEWKLSITKVEDLSFVKLKSKRRVLSDTSPIYRQIISRGILQLINLIEDRYVHTESLLIGYKTDCIYIRHPTDEPLDLVKYKIEKWDERFDPKKTMFYKVEERNHKHILMNKERRSLIKMITQRKDLEWDKVENDDDIINKSCFISAGPGRGKTLRLCELYEKNVSQVLVPTNKAGNVIRKRGPEKVSTFDAYFSADSRMLSYKINRLMIDEISMVKSKWIRKLYKIRVVRPDLIMQVFGDFDQISPVEKMKYNYYDSDVFKQICGNTVTEIEYHEKARYDDEMHEIIEYFKDTRQLHPKLQNRPIDDTLETNIVYTNKTRDRINNKFMKENGGWIMGWKKGLKIITEEKFKKGNIFKGEMFYVESVSDYGKKIQISEHGDGKLHNEGMKYNINLFKPAYAVTMHKYQGDTIGKYINGDLINYNIHNVDHPRLTFNCMLVALSRATTIDQIHLEYTYRKFNDIGDVMSDNQYVKYTLQFTNKINNESIIIDNCNDTIGQFEMSNYITNQTIKQLDDIEDKEYLKLCGIIINMITSYHLIENNGWSTCFDEIKKDFMEMFETNHFDNNNYVKKFKEMVKDDVDNIRIEKMLTLISSLIDNRHIWYNVSCKPRWTTKIIHKLIYSETDCDKPTIKYILKFENSYDKSCVIIHSDDTIGEEQMTKFITKESIKQFGQYDDKEYLKLCASIINNEYLSLSKNHTKVIKFDESHDSDTNIIDNIRDNILNKLQEKDIKNRDIVMLKDIFQDDNYKNHVEKMLTLVKMISLIINNRYRWYTSYNEPFWDSEVIGKVSYFDIKQLNTSMNMYINKYQDMGYVVKSDEDKKREIVVIKNNVNPGKMILKDIKISEYGKYFEIQYVDNDGEKKKKRKKFGTNIAKEDAFFAMKEEKNKILVDKYGFSEDDPIFKRSFVH